MKKQKIEWCVQCGKERIVNRIHNLGKKCNEIRLIGIRGKIEKKGLRPMSRKGLELKDSMHRMYEVKFSHESLCTGCKTSQNLTSSHILPQGQFPQYKDKSWNVTPHCLSCHNKWESRDLKQMKTLLDFDARMQIIRTFEPNYAESILNKIKWQKNE